MCVAFTNIGNDYSLKIKIITVNYALTTNQMNKFWIFFQKKFERHIKPVATESSLYLTYSKLR